MLTLKLFPSEFRTLIGYLRINTEGQDQVPLASQYLPTMVLLHYLNSWKAHRLIVWKDRNQEKEYKLNLPLTVAKALHQEMQAQLLTGHQQLFLNKLDHAIVNYRNPHTAAHVIGDLVVTGSVR